MHATVVVMTSSRHMLGFVMCFFSSRRRHTRCALVTGVQTCALPISRMGAPALARIEREGTFVKGLHSIGELDPSRRWIMHFPHELSIKRSEERRVGKEGVSTCRSRWSPYHLKKTEDERTHTQEICDSTQRQQTDTTRT